MNRWQQLLMAVIVAEVVAGAILWIRQRPDPPPAPPEIDSAAMDPLAADEIRELHNRSRTDDDHVHLAEVYLAFGRARESAWCLSQVVTEDRPERNFDLAFTLERLGALDEAMRYYLIALRNGHPHPEEIRYFIARNNLRAEDEDKAAISLDRAGKLPAARYQKAILLARQGDIPDVRAILDELTRAHPQAIQPHLLRYKIELPHHRPEQARYSDLALHASDRLPNPFDRQWNRLESRYKNMGLERQWTEAREELKAGRHDLAAARLKSALARQWEPAGVDLLAEAEILASRSGEAVRVLEEVIEKAGPTVHFLTRLGDAHAEADQTEQAAKAWTRATELGIGADVKDVHYKLSEHHKKAGRRAESRRHLAQAYFAAGHGAYWTGQLGDALEAFTQASELAPRSAPTWFYLGQIHRRSGRAAEARKAYQTCLEIDPDPGRAHEALALLAAR